MENKFWYGVMLDRDDHDWGYGSSNYEEAMRMVLEQLENHPDAYIAVINQDSDPVCVKEIYPDNFDNVYYYAAQIIKAKDWEEAREDIERLMYWLDMDEEYKAADADNFEDVLRKAGKKIGVDLV